MFKILNKMSNRKQEDELQDYVESDEENTSVARNRFESPRKQNDSKYRMSTQEDNEGTFLDDLGFDLNNFSGYLNDPYGLGTPNTNVGFDTGNEFFDDVNWINSNRSISQSNDPYALPLRSISDEIRIDAEDAVRNWVIGNDIVSVEDGELYRGPLYEKNADNPMIDDNGNEIFFDQNDMGDDEDEFGTFPDVSIKFFYEAHLYYDEKIDYYEDLNDNDAFEEVIFRDIWEYVNLYFPGLQAEQDGTQIKIQKIAGGYMLHFRICVYVEEDGSRELTIYIEHLNKGAYSGNECIERLQILSRRCNIKYLMLQDESHRPVMIHGHKRKLNLAISCILSSGCSWYNSLGFRQANYDQQKKYWDMVTSTKATFIDIIPILMSMGYDLYYEKTSLSWYDDGFCILRSYQNEIHGIGFTPINQKIESVDYERYKTSSIKMISDFFSEYIDRPVVDTCSLFYLELKDISGMTIKEYDFKYAFISICGYIMPYYRYYLAKKLF
jgi:hypothetical protein